MKFKVAVIGSRSFTNYQRLESVLLYSFGQQVKNKSILIVSGGASGADTLAERFAKEYSLEKEIYPANWDKYGKKAGYLRNEMIVKNSDTVIAFWDGISKGTKHSINLAKKHHKALLVIDVAGGTIGKQTVS